MIVELALLVLISVQWNVCNSYSCWTAGTTILSLAIGQSRPRNRFFSEHSVKTILPFYPYSYYFLLGNHFSFLYYVHFVLNMRLCSAQWKAIICTLHQWWAATMENLSVKAMRWFFTLDILSDKATNLIKNLQIWSDESTNFPLDFNILSDKAIIHQNS